MNIIHINNPQVLIDIKSQFGQEHFTEPDDVYLDKYCVQVHGSVMIADKNNIVKIISLIVDRLTMELSNAKSILTQYGGVVNSDDKYMITRNVTITSDDCNELSKVFRDLLGVYKNIDTGNDYELLSFTIEAGTNENQNILKVLYTRDDKLYTRNYYMFFRKFIRFGVDANKAIDDIYNVIKERKKGAL